MIRCKTLVYQYQDRMENASESRRKQRELESAMLSRRRPRAPSR